MEAKPIKIDRNGTQYFQSHKCRKCGGTGYLNGYEHIDGARCWRCGATGREEKPYTWKVYMPEYAKKLADRRRAKMIAQAPKANREFFEKNGFDADGKTHIVLGDTYAMKDELKAAGAKFSDYLGWHFVSKSDGFDTFEISISEVGEQTDLGVWQFLYHYEVIEIIKAKKDALARKTESQYIGTVGDVIVATVKLVSIHTYTTHFTYSGETNYIYKFTDENGNTIVWKTSSWQKIEEGNTYEIKGKIKEHSEYKGDKQTVLTRCKLK